MYKLLLKLLSVLHEIISNYINETGDQDDE